MSLDKKGSKILSFLLECIKIAMGLIALIVVLFVAGAMFVIIFDHASEMINAICSTGVLGGTTCFK